MVSAESSRSLKGVETKNETVWLKLAERELTPLATVCSLPDPFQLPNP
jgi:hypothetical protein